MRRRSRARAAESSVALDGRREVAPVVLGRAEHPGVDEAEQRVEVHQVVLDRGAGGHEAKARLQPPGRPGAFRRRVLDGLRLVEHRAVPVDSRERSGVDLKQPVGGDDDIEGPEIIEPS